MVSDLRFLFLQDCLGAFGGSAQVVLACVDHGGLWLREDRSRGRRPGHGKLAAVVLAYLGTPGSGAS